MERDRKLPRSDQLSLLLGVILLAYALTPYVDISVNALVIRLFGAEFSYNFNFSTLMSLFIAILAAAGSDWLLRNHPKYTSRVGLQHLIVPALTAWLIGVPINNLEVDIRWWIVLFLGGILLLLVYVAEYIAFDMHDVRHEAATLVLTAVSFALFLFLAVAVRTAGLRLYLAVPALSLSIFVFCLRSLFLKLNGRWFFHWAAVSALIIGQLVIGMHYWSIEPVKFGILLVGPAYGLTSYASLIEEGRDWRTAVVEPLIMIVLCIVLAVFL